MNLVLSWHVFIKYFHRQLYHRRMCDPRAVVTVSDLTKFIGTHFLISFLVLLRIIFNRYLCSHSTNRRCTSFMARLDRQKRIRTHKRRFHRDVLPIWKKYLLMILKALDTAKYIIPPSTVKTS